MIFLFFVRSKRLVRSFFEINIFLVGPSLYGFSHRLRHIWSVISPMGLFFNGLCLINDTHRKNCVLLNSVQEFIETKVSLLPMFTQLINFYIFYCHIIRCLKNVIHQICRNEWLLLSAFQQGLRLNLSWFLS